MARAKAGKTAPGRAARKRIRQGGLRDACAAMALAIIEKDGLEKLSLREVARRLGVSHQAPYKHFENRDHLLAEVVGRAYAAFAAHLETRPRRRDPYDDLREMGKAYVHYALAHPLNYRLMFGTPLPDPERHPEMLAEARHAFAMLHEAIGRLDAKRTRRSAAELDALYVWATVHGMASILQSSAMSTLPLAPGVLAGMDRHVMERLRAALSASIPVRQG